MSNWGDKFGWNQLENPTNQDLWILKNNSTDTETKNLVAIEHNQIVRENPLENQSSPKKLVAPQSEPTKNQRKFKNLPHSKKLDRYETIPEFIQAFLQKNAPIPATISDILNWLYPLGLERQTRKQAYRCIANCLAQYVDHKWRRIKPGFYIWDKKLAN